jgi:hypothetical protein
MEKKQNNYDNQDAILPDNVSPIRYMVDEAFSLNTQFIKSYEEAKETENAIVIMEGDWGGQIYLVCPLEYIKCDKNILEGLLQDLDKIAWKCNEGEGTGIYFEVRKLGEGISGGMGGGTVQSGIWIHDEFKKKGFEEEIKQVILGKKERIKKEIQS